MTIVSMPALKVLSVTPATPEFQRLPKQLSLWILSKNAELFLWTPFLFDDSFLTVLDIDATLHWTCYSLTLQVIQILIL